MLLSSAPPRHHTQFSAPESSKQDQPHASLLVRPPSIYGPSAWQGDVGFHPVDVCYRGCATAVGEGVARFLPYTFSCIYFRHIASNLQSESRGGSPRGPGGRERGGGGGKEGWEGGGEPLPHVPAAIYQAAAKDQARWIAVPGALFLLM